MIHLEEINRNLIKVYDKQLLYRDSSIFLFYHEEFIIRDIYHNFEMRFKSFDPPTRYLRMFISEMEICRHPSIIEAFIHHINQNFAIIDKQTRLFGILYEV